MAKHMIKLTLVEMYAIKHALQSQVLRKNNELNVIKPLADKAKKVELLEKDIPHEEDLISMFEQEISEYRAAKRIS